MSYGPDYFDGAVNEYRRDLEIAANAGVVIKIDRVHQFAMAANEIRILTKENNRLRDILISHGLDATKPAKDFDEDFRF